MGLISDRMKTIGPSVTLATSAKAKQLKAAGIDVISLAVGEPDFQTADSIKQAAIQAIENGNASYYTPTPGVPALRQAVLKRTAEDLNLDYEDNQVIVADGAKNVLYNLFQAILNEKDEVLIFAPYWVSYTEQVKLASGTPVTISTEAKNDYKVTVAELDAAITSKTKALILNSPSNPTGMIYSKEELLAIGNWAVKHNILIVSDEIYGKLIYNGHEFISIATLSDEIKAQTILVNGVSKSYAMTGWRIGYALGNPEIIKAMIDVASHSTSNPTAVSQYAAIEALTGSQEIVEKMRLAFEERLNTAYPLLAAIPGFEVIKPHGAFYLFPNVRQAALACGFTTVDEFVDGILMEAHVAVVQGSGFGSKDNLRISYATDLETLTKGIERIHQYVLSKMND
ncbi:pyridoxal phosphate-dependent aminotransferase [Carnobacterium gallinarum]|uniref:pyridoxal phosphate-dependent aminotransferase n=1 Tax=Carnobacterium gallinarum TaxID=2749 RepID=UPI0005501FBD|nr:pyridoxal phosphate-dependent aminotransferase [Carnobacterium gallinarum]